MTEEGYFEIGIKIHKKIDERDSRYLKLLKGIYQEIGIRERVYIDKIIRYGVIVAYSEKRYKCSRARDIMRDIRLLEKEINYMETIKLLKNIEGDI